MTSNFAHIPSGFGNARGNTVYQNDAAYMQHVGTPSYILYEAFAKNLPLAAYPLNINSTSYPDAKNLQKTGMHIPYSSFFELLMNWVSGEDENEKIACLVKKFGANQKNLDDWRTGYLRNNDLKLITKAMSHRDFWTGFNFTNSNPNSGHIMPPTFPNQSDLISLDHSCPELLKRLSDAATGRENADAFLKKITILGRQPTVRETLSALKETGLLPQLGWTQLAWLNPTLTEPEKLRQARSFRRDTITHDEMELIVHTVIHPEDLRKNSKRKPTSKETPPPQEKEPPKATATPPAPPVRRQARDTTNSEFSQVLRAAATLLDMSEDLTEIYLNPTTGEISYDAPDLEQPRTSLTINEVVQTKQYIDDAKVAGLNGSYLARKGVIRLTPAGSN